MPISANGPGDKDKSITRRSSLPASFPTSKPQPVNTAEVPKNRIIARSPSAKAAARAADMASNVASAKSPGSATYGGRNGRIAEAIAAANAFEATPTVPAPLRAASSSHGPAFRAEEGDQPIAPAGGPKSPERPREPFGALAASIRMAAPSPEPTEPSEQRFVMAGAALPHAPAAHNTVSVSFFLPFARKRVRTHHPSRSDIPVLSAGLDIIAIQLCAAALC